MTSLLRSGAISVGCCRAVVVWRDINDYETGSVVSVIGHLLLLSVLDDNSSLYCLMDGDNLYNTVTERRYIGYP